MVFKLHSTFIGLLDIQEDGLQGNNSRAILQLLCAQNHIYKATVVLQVPSQPHHPSQRVQQQSRYSQQSTTIFDNSLKKVVDINMHQLYPSLVSLPFYLGTEESLTKIAKPFLHTLQD